MDNVTLTKSGKHCGKRRNFNVLCNFFFCHYVFKKPSAADLLYVGNNYRNILTPL